MSKPKGKILIIDDNEELLIAFKLFLNPHFEIIITDKNPNRIPEFLRKNVYDVILLDMNFAAGVNTGNEGIFWMNKILEIDSLATIVLITAYGDVALAVKAMKEGATDFIQKSWDEEKILSTILSAYKLRQSKLEIECLKQKQNHLTDSINNENTVCRARSAAMQHVYKTIDKVAVTDANVLILGENGTGKEIIARELHGKSNRANDIFVGVDVGALTETLFESEMFGHVKGAFTDAKTNKAGRFEIASGGTLFLDEIGNLSLSLQSKLLSALQNRSITRLGSNTNVAVDIRLICATNMPLYKMVEESKFREDLLYRVNTIQIELPPLRDRIEDIAVLVDFFVEQFSRKYNKAPFIVNKEVYSKLKEYNWPGNIRELQHVVEKAVIFSENNRLTPDVLFLQSNTGKNKSDTYNLAENEKQIISSALKMFSENISLAAKKLGINRSTLYDKIKKYGI